MLSFKSRNDRWISLDFIVPAR